MGASHSHLPISATTVPQGGSRPIPSPGPGLAQMVGLEKMLAPEDSSRWECFLGTEPRGKGVVSWLLETDATISLPTSC